MAQTLSFLFTDIEGSTPLWDSHPAAMRAATERHNALLREAILAHHGETFRVIGDAFCVAFAEAEPALCAAVDGQRALRSETWGDAPIHVRMGLHSGAVEATEDEIFRGPALARTARVMSAAHGDQILASAATVALLDGKLPPGAALRDLGDHTLRGFVRPERLYQLVVPGLRADFPPIHTAQARRSNLPETLTSFIGRMTAVAEVRDLVRRSRMVTLVGSGGTGKTRLALQAANELVQAFQDGVWLVDVAAHSTLNEAKLAWAEGDRATALENAKAAAASFRQLHFSNALVSALGVVARLQFADGEGEAARKALGEALREQRGLTRDRRLPMLLELVAETCAEFARAAALLGGASALRERLSVPVFPVERDDHDRGCAAVRARYAPCDYDQALEAGRSLSRDDLIDIALSVLETKDCA